MMLRCWLRQRRRRHPSDYRGALRSPPANRRQQRPALAMAAPTARRTATGTARGRQSAAGCGRTARSVQAFRRCGEPGVGVMRRSRGAQLPLLLLVLLLLLFLLLSQCAVGRRRSGPFAHCYVAYAPGSLGSRLVLRLPLHRMYYILIAFGLKVICGAPNTFHFFLCTAVASSFSLCTISMMVHCHANQQQRQSRSNDRFNTVTAKRTDGRRRRLQII